MRHDAARERWKAAPKNLESLQVNVAQRLHEIAALLEQPENPQAPGYRPRQLAGAALCAHELDAIAEALWEAIAASHPGS